MISAFTTFSKRFPTFPIALNSAPYGDLYFSNRNRSPLIERFTANILKSPHQTVELPHELLSAYQHRLLDVGGVPRLLPSFRATCGQED